MSGLAILLILGQLSTGSPVPIAPPAGVAPVRWPDVAFSTTDNVFLAVSGADDLLGQYFSSTGAALGSVFTVNSGNVFGQAPRVTWSATLNAFLVTWHETIGNDTRIRGRLIRYSQPALTDDFDISAFGTNWEMGATSAASTTEFLVAWQDRATTHIHAQRISNTGTQLGTAITVATVPYARDPSVAYDPDTDRYLVVYAGCVGTDDCFVHAQRIQAGTGALVGTPIVLEPSVRAGYIPELSYNALTRKFLVVWFRISAAGNGLYAKTVDVDGMAGPLIAVSAVASYDANDVAWNPISNTFVVVTHSSTAQDLALELDANGQPLAPTGVLFGALTGNGNFNPRLCASTTGADWLGVTSSEFSTLTGQRITTSSRDETGRPDAGTPVIDAGTPELDAGFDAGAPIQPDAGTAPAIDGGTNQPQADGGTNITGVGSCGCTTVTSLELWALFAGAAWFSSRRAARCR